MFAGSNGAIIIGAAAAVTAGRSGSRDTITTIITGTIITAGTITDPESCGVPDRCDGVLRRVFLGREARRFTPTGSSDG
jgi:hypothetical protein